MDVGTWKDTLHGVTKSWVWLGTHTYVKVSRLHYSSSSQLLGFRKRVSENKIEIFAGKIVEQ